MTKVFHFDSSPEPYQCDAAIVWCFDNRFELVMRKFLKRRQIFRGDSIQIAGGAKSLASPREESERTLVLRQILTSIELHATKRVLLAVHSDCGAYRNGGQLGRAQYEQELRRASAFLNSQLPDIAIECYFVDFEGVWLVEHDTLSPAIPVILAE